MFYQFKDIKTEKVRTQTSFPTTTFILLSQDSSVTLTSKIDTSTIINSYRSPTSNLDSVSTTFNPRKEIGVKGNGRA